MAVITLTTDMGNSGYYVASVKAAIIKGLPDANVVDITHSIRPFHVSSAAFIIRNVYKQFPEGAIHIVADNLVVCLDYAIHGIWLKPCFDGPFPVG